MNYRHLILSFFGFSLDFRSTFWSTDYEYMFLIKAIQREKLKRERERERKELLAFISVNLSSSTHIRNLSV